MRLTEPPGAFSAGQAVRICPEAPVQTDEKPPAWLPAAFLERKEKREEKWMNVYLKGCCWLSTKISVKQLPYAPRIPDFGRFVVNSL